MVFTLPPLPYAHDALAPHISSETLQFHHGKHHAGYVAKLNGFIEGTAFAGKTLEEVIRTSTGAIFNNAAQVWNHTFYFSSMKPPMSGGGGEPTGRLLDEIKKEFTSVENFKDEFSKVAAGHFGSGWAWLVWDKQGKKVGIEQTHDAGTPITEPMKVPLLCCDVWEHAYYLDRKNDRPAYIKGRHHPGDAGAQHDVKQEWGVQLCFTLLVLSIDLTIWATLVEIATRTKTPTFQDLAITYVC